MDLFDAQRLYVKAVLTHQEYEGRVHPWPDTPLVDRSTSVDQQFQLHPFESLGPAAREICAIITVKHFA
jgi:hypothetical protein